VRRVGIDRSHSIRLADFSTTPTVPEMSDPTAMELGPLALYRARRRAGQLAADPTQELAAEKLEASIMRSHYQPAAGPVGWRARLDWRAAATRRRKAHIFARRAEIDADGHVLRERADRAEAAAFP
jgi:hypothetical protein